MEQRFLEFAHSGIGVAEAVEGFVIKRLDGDRGPVGRDGLVEPPHLAERVASVPVSFGVVRPDRYRLLVMDDGLVGLPKQMKCISKIVEGLGIVGPGRDGFLVVLDCFIKPLQHLQRVAKVVLGFGKFWTDRNRFGITANRFLQASKAGQRRSEQLVDFGGTLVHLDGAAYQALGFRKPLLLQPYQTEAAKRLEMAIVPQQHYLIELFGVRQTAAVMQGNRALEKLGSTKVGVHLGSGSLRVSCRLSSAARPILTIKSRPFKECTLQAIVDTIEAVLLWARAGNFCIGRFKAMGTRL